MREGGCGDDCGSKGCAEVSEREPDKATTAKTKAAARRSFCRRWNFGNARTILAVHCRSLASDAVHPSASFTVALHTSKKTHTFIYQYLFAYTTLEADGT